MIMLNFNVTPLGQCIHLKRVGLLNIETVITYSKERMSSVFMKTLFKSRHSTANQHKQGMLFYFQIFLG